MKNYADKEGILSVEAYSFKIFAKGVPLGILGGFVPPGSSNPDLILDENTRNLASKILTRFQT